MAEALGALATLLGIILFWLKRPRASIDPKIKEAMKIREEANELTNQTLLKLQQRRMEELEDKLDLLDRRLDTVLMRKNDTTH